MKWNNHVDCTVTYTPTVWARVHLFFVQLAGFLLLWRDKSKETIS